MRVFVKNSANRIAVLFCLLTLCQGCASTLPELKFQKADQRSTRPEEFEWPIGKTSLAKVKVSLDSPEMRGSAKGTIRATRNGHVLLEVLGRNDVFLKVYFTDKQVIVWPEAGQPQSNMITDIPSINDVMNQSMPNWRIDDILPISMELNDEGERSWALGGDSRYLERIRRQGFDDIYKEYSKPERDSICPFRKVVLRDSSGKFRMTWTIKD